MGREEEEGIDGGGMTGEDAVEGETETVEGGTVDGGGRGVVGEDEADLSIVTVC